MKLLCLVVLALCALVTGDTQVEETSNDYHVSRYLSPYSQEFMFLRSNPEWDLSADELSLLEKADRSLIVRVIEDTLNGFRDVVINGNNNLPPLDPLVLDQVGPYDFSVTGVRVRGSINNLRAEGLRWYVVDYVTFNALRLNLGVHLTLPWLNVNGAYDAEVRVAILLTHRAGGNFRIFLNRLEVGVDARLGTNLIGGHLLLRELNIKIDIHDTQVQIDGMTGSSLINNIISSYVQNMTQEMIQNEMQNVSQILSEELFDTINGILKEYTLADILG